MKKLNILIVAAFLTACTEEIAVSNAEGNKLTFCIETDDMTGDAELTRSIALENAANPIKIETSHGPLYIHRIVERRATTNSTTRGTLVDEISGTAGFGVSGYRYTPPTATVNSVNANFFYNAKVTKDANGKWIADKSYYWPTATDRLDFCAYYPYVTTTGATNITDIAGNSTTDMGPMKISYTVDENISNQTDLMTAYTPNQTFSKNAEVPLTFRHALTAVNFQLGDDVTPGYIKRVILSDIYTSGTLTLGTPNSWHYNTAGDFTIEYADASNNGGFSTTQENRQLTTTPVLMIPQSHARHGDFEPSMTVVINDSETGNDADNLHPLSVKLGNIGTGWEAGTQVTYLITTTSINVLRMGTISYPASWGDDAFSVKTAYEEGDIVGVFAVDANGKIIKANKPYRYNGTSWIATNTNDTLRYSSTTNYYLYYPYQNDLKGGRALGSSFNDNPSSANVEDAFFADVISQWTVTADQSTRSKLLANDLQIAKATPGSTAMYINATMKHVMGLAKITQGYVTSNSVTTYYNTSNTELYSISGSTSNVYTTTEISGNNLPLVNNNILYYILSLKESTIFTSNTDVIGEWKEPITITGVSGTVSIATPEFKKPPSLVTYKGICFDFVANTVQQFSVNVYGTYKLEVWGAAGGSSTGNAGNNVSCNGPGGKGGYSYGYVALGNGTLYVCVGGQGANTSRYTSVTGGAGGYNGGGKGGGTSSQNYFVSAGGGGGATHIATADGILKNVSSNNVLIVAGGGGGGAGQRTGGVGGGTSGGNAVSAGSVTIYGASLTGGGYAYGQGQNGVNANGSGSWSCEGTGGGGGGYYGGRASQLKGTNSTSGGSGGCGYVCSAVTGSTIAGNSSFRNTSASGNETGHAGNGYARIATPEIISITY